MRSSSSLLVLLLAAPFAYGAGGRITALPDATVAGDTIRLGDVAAVEGPDATALAAVRLGPAPGAGESRMLDGQNVLDAVRRAGVDLASVTYTIPASIRVRRASQDVSEEVVRHGIQIFLGDALGAGAADAVLRSVDLPGAIRVPAGACSARVVAQPGRAVLGRMRFQVEILVDDRPVRTAWVTADVAVYGSVLVATRPVARGETIAAADVTVERRDLAEAGKGVLGAPEEAIGRVARAALVAWAPLRREQIETAADVHRGDLVLLVAERRGLRITVAGEVRENAGRGEQVHVFNRTSRKDLIGRVVDANTVVVDF